VVDELKLDITTPEHEVASVTFQAMRDLDANTDQEKVKQLLDEYRAGALGVIGARDTLMALSQGQVNELLLSARKVGIQDDIPSEEDKLLAAGTPLTSPDTGEPREALIADALVMRARQTGARITFIEDPNLLADVGGVGGLLRYRT
jgi:peptide subunit release factor 1 (eRF1)